MTSSAAVVVMGLLAGPAGEASPWLAEPLPTRNQHPLFVIFFDLPVAGARTLPRGEVQMGVLASYSSISQSGFGGRYQAVFDGELARAGVSARWGATDDLELSIEVPLAYASGGFLDHLIEGYHRTLGLPQTAPAEVPEGVFEVRAARDGDDFFSVEPHRLAFGDLNVAAKLQLLSEEDHEPITLAARAGIEPPTGSESRGFGSGTWDAGIGLVAERRFGIFTTFLDVDVMLPDLFEDFEGADPHPFLSLSPAVRADVLSWVGVIAQVDFNTNVLRNAEISELERNQSQLVLGAEFRVSGTTSFQVAFAEDLVTKRSPDFTAIAGIRLRF